MRAAAALVAGIALAGCAALAPPPGQGPVLSGRIAVQVDAPRQGGPAQSLNAHFELTGDARRGSLALSTPLGTRLGEASWAPGEVTLVRSGGSRTAYPDLDALTRELLGETVPVGALFDWLAGRPWPAAPAEPAPAPAALGFRQLGWQVDLNRFAEGMIVARREAPPVVTVRARLDAQPSR